ncbi:MAG: hypothetical protein II687_06750, partial [Selenomonadaceae bacterium]|nr:hypothetical protein [Selenomonadaceae bacterium]
MKTIHQIPFTALGIGAAFTVLWGVADPMAANAEVKMYTGVGTCTIGDIGTPAQAKNLAREKALQNAREQAGVYVRSYTHSTNAKLADSEISAITNTITSLMGEVKYEQKAGMVDGQPVIIYTATLQANVDTEGIKKWLDRGGEANAIYVEENE